MEGNILINWKDVTCKEMEYPYCIILIMQGRSQSDQIITRYVTFGVIDMVLLVLL